MQLSDNDNTGNRIRKFTRREEDISGVLYPAFKIYVGAPNVNDGPVSNSNPMPVKAERIEELLVSIDQRLGMIGLHLSQLSGIST